MSSIKSSSSLGEPNGKDDARYKTIIKMGYVKKLKTMRKKFFVIHGDTAENSTSTARIEYYDSEKKWRNHHLPKRSILLKTCFNINRRVDTKHKYVIALYTKDDCFCLVFDTEEEMSEWLKALLSLQQGEDVVDGESPKPTFEHVWQVTLAKRGLGSLRNILGPHLLCLTDRTLSLVKINQNEKTETYEFSLTNIRRCGDMESFFYMEVGRSSCTGAGDLWMQTEDTNIAQNMHAAILHAMSNNSAREELGPRPRNRSSSATESSKPISVLHRRQTHAGSGKPGGFFPTEDATSTATAGCKLAASSGDQPVSPATAHIHAQSNPVCYPHRGNVGLTHASLMGQLPSQRRHSVSAMSVTPSGGPTHQRTHSFPLSDPSALPPWDNRRGSTGRVGKRGNNSRSTTNAGRERCDSMPSRARTTSEGHHAPPVHVVRNAHLVPGHGRPHSMYTRGISYSPPVGSSPVSPASGACSTDSAGSSLSVDDEHNWADSESVIFGIGRYGHSLTPDEPIIFEENDVDDKLNDYMPMDRSGGSLSLPIQTVKPVIKYSPNLSSSGFKSGSPSASSYLDKYSPCSSSPLDTVTGYMAMSPGQGEVTRYGRSVSSASHSRASSLAEDGYVPMAPGRNDDGYVDMDPATADQFEISPGNSSSSIASGTPSTDHRFSEYPLEKVSSYFTPSEEEADRPTRAYSVGSRPAKQPESRVRACSVGSRAVLSHSWSGHKDDYNMMMDFTSKSLKNRNNNMRQDRLSVPFNNLSISPKTPVAVASNPIPVATNHLSSAVNQLSQSPVSAATNQLSKMPAPMATNQLSRTPVSVATNQLSRTPVSVATNQLSRTPVSLATNQLSRTPVSLATNQLSPPMTGYVEMKPGASIVSPPTRKTTVMGPPPFSDPYITPQHFPSTTSHPTPRKPTSPIQEEYMEMNWKQVKQESNAAHRLDLPSATDDYMNMSNEGRRKRRGKRFSSQPIAIQSSQAQASSASTSPVLTLAELMATRRKVSAETPPKYLPIASPNSSPYSSLRRNRVRKQPRRESSETPTGVFPFSLNSPGSPMKPLPGELERKCPVDATSGTVYIDGSCGSNPETPDSSSSSEQPTPVNTDDYVNYSPARRVPATDPLGDGDYAIMRPGKPGFQASFQPPITDTASSPKIVSSVAAFNKASSLFNRQLSSASASSTESGKSQAARQLSNPSASSTDSSKSPAARQLSNPAADDGAYESLSELHYASLDLATEAEEGVRFKTQTSLTESTPSPNPGENDTFTYAEIDFVKSENSSTAANRKPCQ